MSHRMGYRLVMDEFHRDHIWVKDEWHVGHRICYRCVKGESHMSHGFRYKWVIRESHVGQTLFHIGLSWITGWIIDGSYMGLRWVISRSHMSHALVTLSNATYLNFSKLINLWPRHILATLHMRKVNVIFDQLQGSNPVVSLSTLLWHVMSWFFAHLGGEMIYMALRSLDVWRWEKVRLPLWKKRHQTKAS